MNKILPHNVPTSLESGFYLLAVLTVVTHIQLIHKQYMRCVHRQQNQ